MCAALFVTANTEEALPIAGQTSDDDQLLRKAWIDFCNGFKRGVETQILATCLL